MKELLHCVEFLVLLALCMTGAVVWLWTVKQCAERQMRRFFRNRNPDYEDPEK